MSMVTAAILAVGTELLSDGRVDTNGVTLSRVLAAEGVATGLRLQLADDPEAIGTWLARCADAFPVVIVSGGLGPTLDDVTRDAVSAAFGLPLRRDARVLSGLEARYRSRGREVTEPVARQADVPAGAVVLPNRDGTAPGLLLERPGGGVVVLLPGVPHEMERIMTEEALPRLRGLWSGRADAEAPIVRPGLKVAGLYEVDVQSRVADLFEGHPEWLTLLASAGEITVIVGAPDPVRARELLRGVRARLGDHVFTEDPDEGLEHVVARGLTESGLRLAIAESCTGGLLGSMLTRVPGASSWFVQGWITYSDDSKHAALGVDPGLIRRCGAVSAEVAEAMAAAARERSGADLAVSITGIAGPDGGTTEKPVGLVYIGLADADASRATKHRFPGGRETVRMLSARNALDRIRRRLIAG